MYKSIITSLLGSLVAVSVGFSLPSPLDLHPQDAGSEGGELVFLGAPNFSNWHLDSYQATFRVHNGTTRLMIDGWGRVGIGVNSPTHKLTVSSANPDGDNWIGSFQAGHDANGNPKELLLGYHGGEDYAFIQGHHSSVAWTNLVLQRYGGNVGIGTTTPSHKLSVNGTIKAKEVIVDSSGWADDALLPDYPLLSLPEVARHIAEKGTLPGVPSAQTVLTEGIAIGEMQAVLLRKVEELTRYQIEQHALLQRQQETIERQEQVIARQEERLARLESERQNGSLSSSSSSASTDMP